jgi:hypothetical protein
VRGVDERPSVDGQGTVCDGRGGGSRACGRSMRWFSTLWAVRERTSDCCQPTLSTGCVAQAMPADWGWRQKREMGEILEKIARDEGNTEMKPEGGARDRRDWRESDARGVAREGKGVSTEKTNKKGCAVVGTFGRHFTPTGDVGGKVWGVQRARVRGNGRVMCRSTRWTDVQVGS